MSEDDETEIVVFEGPSFKKAFKKLSEEEKLIVEDVIDEIIADPEIGQRKKGDLSYMWVYKFKIDSQEALLGYSWKAEQLEVYLLTLGYHENFYQGAKRRRKADLRFMG